VWPAHDAEGSTITLDPGFLCASGTAIQVPYGDAGQPDWSGAWGVMLGWNLNQQLLPDGGTGAQNPANLAGMTLITVGIADATGLNLRIELNVNDADSGTQAHYCASIPSAGGTISLSSLTKDCWTSGGAPFDPATMHPVNLSIQVVTTTVQAYPFNFCVTALSIQ
jgi:hypothetical protein